MTRAPLTAIPLPTPAAGRARDRALEAIAQMYGYYEPETVVATDTSADYDRQAA